jgi:hypothetical protein
MSGDHVRRGDCGGLIHLPLDTTATGPLQAKPTPPIRHTARSVVIHRRAKLHGGGYPRLTRYDEVETTSP